MTAFDNFFALLPDTVLSRYESAFRQTLTQCFQPDKHGDWQHWMQAFNALPDLNPSRLVLNADTVAIGTPSDATDSQRNLLEKNLRTMHPWRKGPFDCFGIHIDTEWRSDWKWQRIAPYLSPLENKTVLDVGCGSGYHCLRMRGAGARFVVGIDPSMKFLMQFLMLKKFLPREPVFVLPLRCEDLPPKMAAFDTVFSMGVFYHRRSPFDHLEELLHSLVPGGELVLETLVIKGNANEVLVPQGRYAQMRNVWFLPSTDMLCSWLKRSGFINIRLVDVNQTRCEEQRSTDWMRFHSLQNYLDPDNPNLTVEGLPAPIRATVIANRP